MLPTSRYMCGITRPRALRVITRSGGGHLERLKVDQFAFSDTDTLPDTERAPGASRGSDFPQVLQGSNPSRISKDLVEAVDTAQQPCLLQQTKRFTQDSESSAASLREISPGLLTTEGPLCGNARPNIDPSFFARSVPQLSFAPQQIRDFHTSSRVPYDSTSYNVTEFPDFFIKYKQQRTPLVDLEVHEPKHEEFGLMRSLADSALSGDLVATTRRPKTKIPVEHHAVEGHVIHPSGFIVPGPGYVSTSDVARAKERERNENKDRLVQTASVAHCVLESDLEQVDATTLPSLHKVPFEVREPDGTIKHPSGFVPPTPAHEFRYTVNNTGLRDRKVSAVQLRARRPSPPGAVLRSMHTVPVPNAADDV